MSTLCERASLPAQDRTELAALGAGRLPFRDVQEDVFLGDLDGLAAEVEAFDEYS